MGSSTTSPWLALFVGKNSTAKRETGRSRRCGRTATAKTLNCLEPNKCCCRPSTRRRPNVNVQRTDVVVIGPFFSLSPVLVGSLA